MKHYTFKSNNGSEVTVEAANEDAAREAAMKQLWGGDMFTLIDKEFKPQPYLGLGLYLEEQKGRKNHE